MGKIYKFLGLSVGLIVHDLDNDAPQKAYAADITYGTNNEFGFDYLRDNMVIRKKERCSAATTTPSSTKSTPSSSMRPAPRSSFPGRATSRPKCTTSRIVCDRR